MFKVDAFSNSSRTVTGISDTRPARVATVFEERRPMTIPASPGETHFDALALSRPRALTVLEPSEVSSGPDGWRSPLERVLGRSEIDMARDARVKLLMKAKSSHEDDARFGILTERLRRLSPAVTDADFRAFQATAKQLEEMDDELAALNKKYGR